MRHSSSGIDSISEYFSERTVATEPAQTNRAAQVQEDEYYIPYHYLYRKGWYSAPPYCFQLERVIAILKENGMKRVLDAGCGDGRLVYEARKAGFDAAGMDIYAQSLHFAKAYSPEAEFAEGDIAAMPFPDASFDAVACSGVLEHVEPDKATKALSEMKRVLRPGGIVIITVPSLLLSVSEKHLWHASPEGLEKMLAGFTDVHIEGRDASSFFLRLPYYFLSFFVLLTYPLRRKCLCFAGWQWVYYKNHLANASPSHARSLLAVGRKSS